MRESKSNRGVSRDLARARQAFRRRDVQASVAAHLAEAEETHQTAGGQYIKSAVYGGLDGIITTFAVVAGAAGASLGSGVVLILGFANLVADGLSMAIGDYLSTKAEQEYQEAERRREQWEIDHFPEGEKKEMIELYTAKGIPAEDARRIVEILAQHPKAWAEVMLVEELGIVESDSSPLANGLVTFCSFALFGLIPLLSYVLVRWVPLLSTYRFAAACAATAFTLFVLGMAKVRLTGRSWILSGLETLTVGGIAAAAAYAVGVLLRGLA